MIELLRKALELILRWLDWRKVSTEVRARREAQKAVATHDREALNRIIQERRLKK